MIEKFTKLMLSLALLVAGAGVANAADVEEELTADMFKTWSTTDASAVVTGDAAIDFNVGVEIENGAVLCGTSGVNGFIYVDLSNYTKIVFTGTPAEGQSSFTLRVLYNREGASGANGEINPVITTETPTVELNIADLKLSYFHLVTIKVGWGQKGTVTSIKLVKPDDPLAVPKENLMNAINRGKAQSDFAKTAESFQNLTDAIANGEAEYANASATESSLDDAKNAITDAIANLKLSDGYVNLTQAMFHEWTGIDDDATIKSSGGCDLNLNTSINDGGMLYGNASVKWDQYAKLIDAKSLIILGTPNGAVFGARTDRLEVGVGGGDGNGGSLTQLDMTLTDGMATIDLSAKSAVRINAIKKSWSGGTATITDLLVEFKPRTVTVGDAGYTTFAPDMNVRATGVTAYAAKVDGSSVTLTPVDEIPANNAVIIEAEANDYELPVIDSAAAIEDNDLKVSDGTVTGDNIYVLANKNSVVGFYKLGAGVTVPAGKAYLQVEAAGRDFIGFGTETTGIKNVESVKGEGEVYNLKGQRVAAPTKGLYVVDGKKVVLK